MRKFTGILLILVVFIQIWKLFTSIAEGPNLKDTKTLGDPKLRQSFSKTARMFKNQSQTQPSLLKVPSLQTRSEAQNSTQDFNVLPQNIQEMLKNKSLEFSIENFTMINDYLSSLSAKNWEESFAERLEALRALQLLPQIERKRFLKFYIEQSEVPLGDKDSARWERLMDQTLGELQALLDEPERSALWNATEHRLAQMSEVSPQQLKYLASILRLRIEILD